MSNTQKGPTVPGTSIRIPLVRIPRDQVPQEKPAEMPIVPCHPDDRERQRPPSRPSVQFAGWEPIPDEFPTWPPTWWPWSSAAQTGDA